VPDDANGSEEPSSLNPTVNPCCKLNPRPSTLVQEVIVDENHFVLDLVHLVSLLHGKCMCAYSRVLEGETDRESM
jgi:hypothetical protein